LNQKWKVTVGKGDATPALLGDKVFVFARDDKGELTLCLDAATGKELWRDSYEAQAANEPMGKHPGPRSSPTVVDGKVLAYGVRGTLSCLDAANGKVLWRKDELGAVFPRFFTASSPLVTDGLCIAQLGSEEKGGIYAYALASGDQKWKWTDDGSAYASPSLLSVEGVKTVVALTAKRVVGLSVSDGKLLWETPFAPAGRAYNAATPIVEGSTVIISGSGRGTKAIKIEKTGDAFAAKELWSNPDNAVQFNTPVLNSGRIYGVSQKGDLFCIDATDGKTLWTSPLGAKDFASVVDAGSVLMAMGTQGELTFFEPSEKEYKKLASYKVAQTEMYAYPVPAGNHLFIKDKDSLARWDVD
jgi:outer membrane protein assembly factor BamB